MALVDLVAALQEAFTVRECPAPIFLGEQYLHDHAGENRVVVIPGTDQFAPPSPSLASPEVSFGGNSINPRPIMTRRVGAVAHLWAMGPSEDLAEDHAYMNALINCFCASLYNVAGGVATIAGGQYLNDQAVHDRKGLAYQLTFAVDIPITDVAWPDGLVTWTTETVDADITINAENTVEETEEELLNFSTADDA